MFLALISFVLFCGANSQIGVPVPVAVPVPRAVPVPVAVAMPIRMGNGLGMRRRVGRRRLNFLMRNGARQVMASNMIAANMALNGLGKRDVSNSTEELDFPVNKTLCNYSSQRGILSCHGLNHNFDCDVTLKMTGLEKLKLRLSELELVPAEGGNFNVLRLFSHKSNFTVVEPVSKKQLVLSLFNGEHVSEPGLMVKDSSCWERVESMVRESEKDNVRLAIFL